MLMHDHPFVYVGDDAGFPYGDWQGQLLTQRVVGLFETLIQDFEPQLAIVACNTASTLIMPALRKQFDIPFVGIVPAIKPAAERTASGLITVLATPGTIKRRYTHELINKFAGHCSVNLVGATQLARLAEQHMQGDRINLNTLREELLPCFIEHEGKRTDIITLGCTHFPFLVNEMRKIAPWPVDWLDPAEAVARQAQNILNQCAHPTTPAVRKLYVRQDIAIMTSDAPSVPTARLLDGLGLQLHQQHFPSLAKSMGTA